MLVYIRDDDCVRRAYGLIIPYVRDERLRTYVLMIAYVQDHDFFLMSPNLRSQYKSIKYINLKYVGLREKDCVRSLQGNDFLCLHNYL